MTEQQYFDAVTDKVAAAHMERMMRFTTDACSQRALKLDEGDKALMGRPELDAGSIDSTLNERGNRYGKFTGHALITQDLKRVMHGTGNWSRLSPDQKEALEMVAHKIGRILNGDPDYHDSWHDIVGYSKLVADRLVGTER